MARRLRHGLNQALQSGSLESHSTLELSLPSDIAPAVNLYLATARVTIDGVAYDWQLRETGAVKTSLTRAADRTTVDIQNADTLFGVDMLRVADTLYGASAKLGRYWRDLKSGAEFHHPLLTGVVAGVEINETVVRLTLVSDMYSTVNVGATEPVQRKCRFQTQGRFRGTECGYSGALLTCNGLLDSADGCDGRHGSPLKRAKFGGYAYIESASTVSGAAALPVPAYNQAIRTAATDLGSYASPVVQQPFFAVNDETFNVTNDATNEQTVITPKGIPTKLYNAVFDYNAVADGVTNTTTELQAAIDAAEAAGGGTVFLQAGTYLVTGLTINGHVKLAGSSDGEVVIYSTTNAPIVDCGQTSFEFPVLENIKIRGDVTAGSSQIGLRIDDALYGLRCTVRNVWIENCGGVGLYVGKAFSSLFENIFVTNCAGYPFLINAPNMPGNVFINCYAGNLRDTAAVGFRVKAGEVLLKSCNGINSLNPGSKWAVVGMKNGVDGDSSNGGAILDLEDCNLESYIDTGVYAYYSSLVNLRGNTTFVGHLLTNQLDGAINNSVTTITVDSTQYFSDTGTLLIDSERITYTGKTATTFTGCTRGAEGTSAASHSDNATVQLLKKPIVWEHINEGTDYFAHTLARGIIEDSVRFTDGGMSNYVRNEAIHANGFPPFQTVGRGARVVSGDPLATYWNSTTSASAKLSRADSYLSKQTVTGSTSFTWPGVHYIEVNHSSAATITLPWAALYTLGSLVIVKDISSAGAATNNITIDSNGGGTVNGSSFAMNADKQSVILAPDGSNDWRIIATYTPGGSVTGSGASTRVAYWNGASSLTSDSDLTFDGFNLTAGRLYHSGGTAGAPGVASSSDSGTGFYLSSSGVYGFASSAANGGAGGNVLLLSGLGITVDNFLNMVGTTDPAGFVDDDVWLSLTRKQLSLRNSGQTENLSASMWKSSAQVFFDTTTTETSLISDTGVGTKTLAANRLVAGSQIRIKAAGLYGTKSSGAGTFTVKLKNGATTMLTIAAFNLPTNVADQNWWMEATGALNATGGSGTIYWTLLFSYNDGTGAVKTQTYTVNSTTINTTTTNALDITGQFSVSDVANYWQTDTAAIEIF